MIYAFFKNMNYYLTRFVNILHTVADLDIKDVTSQFKGCKNNSSTVSY